MGFDHPIHTREASSVAACLLPTTATLSLSKTPSLPCLRLKGLSLVLSSKENILTFLPPSVPAPSSALCPGGSIICLASCRSPRSQRAGQQPGKTSPASHCHPHVSQPHLHHSDPSPHAPRPHDTVTLDLQISSCLCYFPVYLGCTSV